MIDSYELLRAKIRQSNTAGRLGLTAGGYGVVTLHRPANVDDEATLALIVGQLKAAANELPLIFAAHPRTQKRLEMFNLLPELKKNADLRLIEPLGYIDFMSLVEGAKLVITDSGGLQEETTYLGIPCLTLRPNTERPITCTEGSNRLLAAPALLDNVRAALAGDWPRGRRPALWDGSTAARVAESLKQRVSNISLSV
jgi:UDP-N-acetylglucosamine 2-epimerase (non-hydrolysing)